MNARLHPVVLASFVAVVVGSGCRQLLDIDEDRQLIGGAGGTSGSDTAGRATTDTTSTGATTSTGDVSTGTSTATTGGALSEWPAWPLTPEDAPTSNYVVTAEVATDLTTGLVWLRVLAGEPGTYADAVARCDDLEAGTFDDWRLPTRMEIHTLLRFDTDLETINEEVFSGNTDGYFWTSSRDPRSQQGPSRWVVGFSAGGTYRDTEDTPHYATCVRRAPAAASPFQLGDGIIDAPDTGLTWQADPSPDTLPLTWSAANDYCATLDLQGTGWRLPTALELLSIVDTLGEGIELLDATFTQGSKPIYWSKTPYMGLPGHVTVDFRFGGPGEAADGSANTAIARCVR